MTDAFALSASLRCGLRKSVALASHDSFDGTVVFFTPDGRLAGKARGSFHAGKELEFTDPVLLPLSATPETGVCSAPYGALFWA